MRLVDLTYDSGINSEEYRLELKSPGIEYTGVCYDFKMNSMAGTYIDFPGHIAETDNGANAGNYPLEKLFRHSAKVIHLNERSGAVNANELAANCRSKINKGDALVINALGSLRFDEVVERSVYLDRSAVDWIIAQGVEILISDIYESVELIGVFYYLFKSGISTVCCPVNMDKIDTDEIKITILPLPARGAVQIPCRVIAELS